MTWPRFRPTRTDRSGRIRQSGWEYRGTGEQMASRQENDPHMPDDSRITLMAGAFADALIYGDEIAADIAIREAMDAGLSTADIDERLIAPAMWLVGELWERGEISVAEENTATEI